MTGVATARSAVGDDEREERDGQRHAEYRNDGAEGEQTGEGAEGDRHHRQQAEETEAEPEGREVPLEGSGLLSCPSHRGTNAATNGEMRFGSTPSVRVVGTGTATG